MKKAIPFARMRELLLHLGFVERTVPGPYLVYEHAPSETRLFYRASEPGEAIAPGDLLVTRLFLDERGLFEKDEFEEWEWRLRLSREA
jgi:hypothetical protein